MKRMANTEMKNRGFTLTELMVAITISLIILAAVSSLFVNSKTTYTTQDRLGRLQENARFAMQFISRDLRLAGYTGCLNKLTPNETYFNQLNPPSGVTPPSATPEIPLVGADSTVIGGTTYPFDSVTISFVDPVSEATLNVDMTSATANITSTNVIGISKGDIIMLADCSTADLFQVSDISTSGAVTTIQHMQGTSNPAPGNSSNSLSKPYSTTAKIIKFNTRRYFIGMGASGNPALFRADNGGAAQELVDGIENLQVLYGEDTDIPTGTTPTDGVPNTYRSAATVANMNMVTSARVGILARTVNDKSTDTDTLSYDVDGDGNFDAFDSNGKLVASDHNMRRIFRSTVLLRNMRCKQSPSPASCKKT